jgi:hypothetical protein
MSRGKPKNIRRKIAKEVPSIWEKALMSAFGDLADYEERSLIEGIIAEAEFRKSTGKPYMFSDIDGRIVAAFKKAVCNLDISFFVRCQEVLVWLRRGRPVADPLGTRVISVLMAMMSDPTSKEEITSPMVVEKLSPLFPRAIDYEPKDVRNVVKELGLGAFPLSKTKLWDGFKKYLEGRNQGAERGGGNKN